MRCDRVRVVDQCIAGDGYPVIKGRMPFISASIRSQEGGSNAPFPTPAPEWCCVEVLSNQEPRAEDQNNVQEKQPEKKAEENAEEKAAKQAEQRTTT